MKTPKAIDTIKSFHDGADMSSRESEILADIVKKTGFISEKCIWRSPYWTQEQIGAVHYSGLYKKKRAVLKIQGVKPDISEIHMIAQFVKQNRSKIIRPPKLIGTIPWSDKNGYEALIMEHVEGSRIIEGRKLLKKGEVSIFFDCYKEYREKCLPKKPWLPKPKREEWSVLYSKLIGISKKVHPNHPFRKQGDFALAQEVIKALENVYGEVEQEFIHGHFGIYDLVRQGKEVVLFSNLYWKWRYPYFDAVFAYHWFMLELEHVEGITIKDVDNQRKIWLQEIYLVTGATKDREIMKLVNAALLDRAIAAFILDGFYMDPKKKITSYLIDSSRGEVKRITNELRNN